jgi:hypothetical protein
MAACLVAATLSACTGITPSHAEDAGPHDAGAPDAGPPLPMTDAGTITALALGQDNPTNLVLQNGTLYWTNTDDPGTVVSLPVAGGTPTTIASGRHQPSGLAVDAESVYWLDYGTMTGTGANATYNNDGAVLKAPLAGGSVVTLASSLPAPFNIAIDASSVYWVDSGMTADDGAVLSVPIGGGAIATLVSGQESPLGIWVDATNVYWTNGGTFNGTTNLYDKDGSVVQAPIAGGAPVTIASNQDSPGFVISDETRVYWTNEGNLDSSGNVVAKSGSVVEAPIGGGTPVTLATTQDWASGLVLSGGSLVWADTGTTTQDGTLSEAPAGGGTPQIIVSSGIAPVDLVVSGTDIYWTDFGTGNKDGAVFKLAR